LRRRFGLEISFFGTTSARIRALDAPLQPSLPYLEFPAVLSAFRNFVATFVQLRQVTASNLRCPSDLGIRRLSGIVRVLALELAPGSD
jgi:hypothetical protein